MLHRPIVAFSCPQFLELRYWCEWPSKSVSDSATHAAALVPRVALPQLQITPFSGDRRDRQGFEEQFDATNHTIQVLPKLDKFKYIRLCLRAHAKKASEGIHLAEDGYEAAVPIRKDRFGLKDLIIADNVEDVLALSPVKTSADAQIAFRLNALEV